MLKFLVFNGALFSVLFLHGWRLGRFWRVPFALGVAAAGLGLIFGNSLDPLVGVFYLIFACLTVDAGGRFRGWVAARQTALDEEIGALSKKLGSEQERLDHAARETQAAHDGVEQISHLYDKIKEMSQSMDSVETLVIFGEAVARYFVFDQMKLFFYDEEAQTGTDPGQCWALRFSDCQNLLDRETFLKDKARLKGELEALDRKILEAVFKYGRVLYAVNGSERSSAGTPDIFGAAPPFVAYPIVIHKKVVSVVMVKGIRSTDLSFLSILAERFVSEVQRVKLYQKVETLAVTDGLTGIYVRRHLLERLEGEMDRCRRFGFKVSFLMIDVDFFKKFNDLYGHLVGDVVLKQVADTIRRNIRELDLVGRYGGEEFGAILVETDAAGAFLIAERIRLAVAQRAFRAYDELLRVTISVGCSTFSKKNDDLSLLVDAADTALYEAKRQGRNRVCAATELSLNNEYNGSRRFWNETRKEEEP
ncbi:MAG: GGDEF domain-containing protein [Candidatus Omnitrophica bacterium]|nr:GGDEF domain-containing protein [Candidatus Omnitrophota bacterium]